MRFEKRSCPFAEELSSDRSTFGPRLLRVEIFRSTQTRTRIDKTLQLAFIVGLEHSASWSDLIQPRVFNANSQTIFAVAILSMS